MSEEIPEDVKFVVQLMGAMHSSTLNATEGVMRNLTIQGRENEARYELLWTCIMECMDSEFMLSPAVVVNRCYAAVRKDRVEEWLVDNYGENWRDYTARRL